MVDQVSWWMAHRSQGAELKLDLPGGQPVSVSVQVQGNEAQVAFRSDHPEARQWLNAAMPQLKEMLGNEGLMLSGSSVGQSGTGAEREAARDAQRAVHAEGGGVRGTAASATDTTMSAAARPRSVTERALDLYV
jgi:flagellar hook-length control protein FliK